jgi:hypothetical protein
MKTARFAETLGPYLVPKAEATHWNIDVYIFIALGVCLLYVDI